MFHLWYGITLYIESLCMLAGAHTSDYYYEGWIMKEHGIRKKPGSYYAYLVCIAALIVCVSSGCSLRRRAVISFADALGSGAGSTFTSESDLDLVEGSLPFSLKAMESLLAQVPDHRGLHLSLAQGYMLYAYAFVDLKADEKKETDFPEYQRLKNRAKILYLRAYGYAKRGLDLSVETFADACEKKNSGALLLVKKKQDVPFLYWAGVALAKWITLAKTDPSAAIRLPEAAAYMQRALEIDPDYDRGAIHEFFISYEARGAAMGGDMNRAREHFTKALALADGRKLSPLVTYVEACSIPSQNKEEFDGYVRQIMAFDTDRCPDYRLINTLMKKRTEYLLKKKDDLFLGE